MARKLASLTRPNEAIQHNELEDDPIPRDIDELCRELERRLNELEFESGHNT